MNKETFCNTICEKCRDTECPLYGTFHDDSGDSEESENNNKVTISKK
ncbi:MAG: hypothetical protein WCX30_03765 [Candidatus Paceibacterota bacterium]